MRATWSGILGRPMAWVFLSSTVAFVAACDSGPSAPPTNGGNGGGGGGGADAIVIRTTDQLRFEETETLVPAGATVRWMSDSSLPHSITPVGHELWERVEADQRGWLMLELTFQEPGVYEFRCDYHYELGMGGRVIVHPTQSP